MLQSGEWIDEKGFLRFTEGFNHQRFSELCSCAVCNELNWTQLFNVKRRCVKCDAPLCGMHAREHECRMNE